MKKILLLLVIILFSANIIFAEEIYLDAKSLTDKNYNINQQVISEPEKIAIREIPSENTFELQNESQQTKQNKFYNYIKNTASDVYHLQIEDTSKSDYLLKKQLTHKFDSGPLESLHLWSVLQMNNTVTIPQSGSVHDRFNVPLTDVLIDGTFKGGKEKFRIMLEPHAQKDVKFMQYFFQDLYIETLRIPHHSLLIGNSRPGVGHEGTMSSYTLPFIARSQIAKEFGTVRKLGIRLRGNYSLVDYDFGGYSSGTYFNDFFPGAEFDGWVNLKPLGKTDGRYGKLTLGGGITTGQMDSNSFFVTGTYLGYEYKKMWLKAEYAAANGSNGSTGYTNKHRQGWNVTVGYKITPKLEILARYDEFDPDKNISSNNKREYTAGINYYIKGQALRLILNYVFCQNQAGSDSHKIIVGTQIII